MSKYIDAERLKELLNNKYKEFTEKSKNNCFMQYQFMADGLNIAEQVIDSLQQELDSRSISVLRADTTEKQGRILEIIGQDEIYCHFPLDFNKETDCGYEDYNDRVYIDGNLTFNKMAEIVDFLRENSK